MSIINKTILVGRIATKPKLFSKQFKTAISFKLAVNDSFKTKDGQWVNKTTFFPIIAFGEKVSDYIFKNFQVGYLIGIEGKNYYLDDFYNVVLEKITLLTKQSKTKFNIPNSKEMEKTIDINAQIEKMDFGLDKTLELDDGDLDDGGPWELDL